jgi:hypothetical protein
VPIEERSCSREMRRMTAFEGLRGKERRLACPPFRLNTFSSPGWGSEEVIGDGGIRRKADGSRTLFDRLTRVQGRSLLGNVSPALRSTLWRKNPEISYRDPVAVGRTTADLTSPSRLCSARRLSGSASSPRPPTAPSPTGCPRRSSTRSSGTTSAAPICPMQPPLSGESRAGSRTPTETHPTRLLDYFHQRSFVRRNTRNQVSGRSGVTTTPLRSANRPLHRVGEDPKRSDAPAHQKGRLAAALHLTRYEVDV